MACSDQAKAVGVSYGGAVANLFFTFLKENKQALGVTGWVGAVAAMLRLITDMQNLDDCARLQHMDVPGLQAEHARLQRELDELQRQQQAAQQKAGHH